MDDAGAESPPRTLRLPLPTTFGGVAALAERPARWIVAASILTAALAGAVFALAFEATWYRALERATRALPPQAELRDGRLNWPVRSPAILHQGSFLGVRVDLQGQSVAGFSDDATLVLGEQTFALASILGWFEAPYPPRLTLPLGRFEAAGMLAAWKGPFLLGLGTAVALALLASWCVLGLAYGIIFRVLAALLRRDLAFAVAIRLGVACLIPGALLMTAALALYASRQLGAVGLLCAQPLHLLAGWIFAAGAFRHAAPSRRRVRNPFFVEPPAAERRPARRAANPFQST